MKPLIYTGTVRHRRFHQKQHAFTYQVLMFMINIANIESTLKPFHLVSYNRFNWFTYKRKHYFDGQNTPLDKAVRDYLAANSTFTDIGPIYILTNLACFGYCFNPISIYFIYDKGGQTLMGLMLEVSNTPWGERHFYILDKPTHHQTVTHYEFPKALHVSPFFTMAYDYFLNVKCTDESIIAHLESKQEGVKHFDATLSLHPARKNLVRTLIRHAFMTYKVVFWIHWQAVKLKLKGVTFIPYKKKG